MLRISVRIHSIYTNEGTLEVHKEEYVFVDIKLNVLAM